MLIIIRHVSVTNARTMVRVLPGTLGSWSSVLGCPSLAPPSPELLEVVIGKIFLPSFYFCMLSEMNQLTGYKNC